MRNSVVGAILLVLLVITSLSAASFPSLPEFYTGYAYVNGELVAPDTEIKVVSDSGDIFTTGTSKVASGYYQMLIIFDSPDTETDEGAANGEKLTWYIDGTETDIPIAGEDTAISGEQNTHFNIAIGTVPKPTCSDGIRNQNEEGVDCGGPCKSCAKPTTTAPADKAVTTTLAETNATTTTTKSFVDDILSKFGPKETTTIATSQETTTLRPSGATCYDGIRNQNEEGVDCGGPCKPCRSTWLPWWLIIGLVMVLILISVTLIVGVTIYLKKR